MTFSQLCDSAEISKLCLPRPLPARRSPPGRSAARWRLADRGSLPARVWLASGSRLARVWLGAADALGFQERCWNPQGSASGAPSCNMYACNSGCTCASAQVRRRAGQRCAAARALRAGTPVGIRSGLFLERPRGPRPIVCGDCASPCDRGRRDRPCVCLHLPADRLARPRAETPRCPEDAEWCGAPGWAGLGCTPDLGPALQIPHVT